MVTLVMLDCVRSTDRKKGVMTHKLHEKRREKSIITREEFNVDKEP